MPRSFYPSSLIGRLEKLLVDVLDQADFRLLRDQRDLNVLSGPGLACRVGSRYHRLRDTPGGGERAMSATTSLTRTGPTVHLN